MIIDSNSTQQVFEGTWNEVRPYVEDIPVDSHVHLVITPPVSDNKAEQERLQKVFAAFFSEVDKLEFTPPTESLPPTTTAVLDKFRRKGLRA